MYQLSFHYQYTYDCQKKQNKKTHVGKWILCSTVGDIHHNTPPPCGRCTFQLFLFPRQCPDILNMLSAVVSMVQYLHAFCSQRQQKRIEKRQKGKSQQFLHQAKLYLNASYISTPCKAPPFLSSLVPLASWRAE